MHTTREIEQKIFDLAEQFKRHMRKKDIQRAVYECDIRRKAEEAAVWDDTQRRYGGFTH